jgi:hypothetical protein
MANTNGTKQAGRDQGNAIENETRETDPIEEIIRRNAEPSVSEEESRLAEEHPDGGAPGGKKY